MTMNCDVLIALALNDEERDFAKRLINAMFIENPSENDIDALQAVAYLALAVINQLPLRRHEIWPLKNVSPNA